MGRTSQKDSSSVAENRAECPFQVTFAAKRLHAERQKSKRKKLDGLNDDKKEQIQICPFVPTGKFKTHKTMDLYYAVEPSDQWLNMTRYNSFVCRWASHSPPSFRVH